MMKNKIYTGLLAIALLIVGSSLSSQNIIRVNHASTASTPNGTTWALAYQDLQDALTASVAGDEIWIAKGTYYPSTPVFLSFPTLANKDKSFLMKPNMKLIGGFFGNETSSSQANATLYPTILSGDIDRDGILDTDNSFTVVEFPAGFVVQSITHNSNIGNCTLENLIIKNAYSTSGFGGGVYINKCIGQLDIRNCNFADNASGTGGAIYVGEHNPPVGSGTVSLPLTRNSDVILKIYDSEFVNNFSIDFIGFQNTIHFIGREIRVENTLFRNSRHNSNLLYISKTSTVNILNSQFDLIHTVWGHRTAAVLGIYNYNSTNGIIKDCSFTNIINSNPATSIYRRPAAIDIGSNGNLNIDKCLFQGIFSDGSIVETDGSSGRSITNCIFKDNTSVSAAAVEDDYGNLKIANCSFSNNRYLGTNNTIPSCVKNYGSFYPTKVYNCIFWGNHSISFQEIGLNNTRVENSIVQGGYAGNNQSNVISLPPLWIGNDLELPANSPAVDAGNLALYGSPGPSLDVDGTIRHVGNIDMGAQESRACGDFELEYEPWSCSKLGVNISPAFHPGASNILVDWNWGDGSSVQNTSMSNSHQFNSSIGCFFTVTVTVTYNVGNHICQITKTLHTQLPFLGFDECEPCEDVQGPFGLRVRSSADMESISDLNTLEFYPNPTSNSFQVNGFEEQVQITLLDIAGKVVLQTSATNNTQIDVSSLSNGVYILQANDQFNHSIYEKLIIE